MIFQDSVRAYSGGLDKVLKTFDFNTNAGECTPGRWVISLIKGLNCIDMVLKVSTLYVSLNLCFMS